MALSDKVGLIIAAAGLFIDGIEAFFPGALSGIAYGKRKVVFFIGTTLLVGGLGVVMFWPEEALAPPSPPAIFESGSDLIIKDSVFTDNGDRQIGKSRGNQQIEGTKVYGGSLPIPQPSGQLRSLSNKDLADGARSLAQEIFAYGKANAKVATEIKQKDYTARFAGRVTAFTAEMYWRIPGGVKVPTRPDPYLIGSGRMVAITGKLAGMDALIAVDNFLKHAAFQVPPNT